MSNYSTFEIGAIETVSTHTYSHQRLPRPFDGKLFLKDHLNLTGMEISFNAIPPQQEIPFLHIHRHNEEVYLFLSGTGEFQIDQNYLAVQEGTTIRVAPEGERSIRNTGDRPLFYIVIQAPINGLPTGDISDGEAVKKPVQWRTTPVG
jgi:mannose-6-phosphate isomerase-like protein (cupin superfamily)